jgi:glycerophosphoryl diester phosphodiesterase
MGSSRCTPPLFFSPSAFYRQTRAQPTPAPLSFHPPLPPSLLVVLGEQASLEFPENSLASFEAAIAEGSEGIESGTSFLCPLAFEISPQLNVLYFPSLFPNMTDVHTTSDGRILMFHDPSLERTTDGKGEIKTQPWTGVIEFVSLDSL